MGLPKEKKIDVVQFAQDRASYEYWFRKQFGAVEDEDSAKKISRLLSKAIEHELTDIQRAYFCRYYFEGLTMEEIAQDCGTNKSTVSRTIARARSRIGRVLKYVNPRFMLAFERTEKRTQRKNNKSNGGKR